MTLWSFLKNLFSFDVSSSLQFRDEWADTPGYHHNHLHEQMLQDVEREQLEWSAQHARETHEQMHDDHLRMHEEDRQLHEQIFQDLDQFHHHDDHHMGW